MRWDEGRDAKPGNSHTGDNLAGDTDTPVRLGISIGRRKGRINVAEHGHLRIGDHPRDRRGAEPTRACVGSPRRRHRALDRRRSAG